MSICSRLSVPQTPASANRSTLSSLTCCRVCPATATATATHSADSGNVTLTAGKVSKKAFYLRYPKELFWISKITISDIQK